jgi:hypothetical protein
MSWQWAWIAHVGTPRAQAVRWHDSPPSVTGPPCRAGDPAWFAVGCGMTGRAARATHEPLLGTLVAVRCDRRRRHRVCRRARSSPRSSGWRRSVHTAPRASGAAGGERLSPARASARRWPSRAARDQRRCVQRWQECCVPAGSSPSTPASKSRRDGRTRDVHPRPATGWRRRRQATGDCSLLDLHRSSSRGRARATITGVGECW